MSEQKFEHYQQVLVRDDKDEIWKCDLYSHYRNEPDITYQHVCIGGSYKFCIPYEENRNLAGTTDSPDITEELKYGDKVMVSDFRDTPYRKAIFVEYNDRNSKYVVLTKGSRTIDEWRHCRKGWDGEDEK